MSRPTAVTGANDDDLEDLIGSNGEHYEQSAPLNLDSLTQGKLDVSPRSRANRQSFLSSCLNLCQAHLTYFTYAHPVLCSCTVILGIVFGMFVLVNAIFNPTETFGVINNDYSDIQSQYDLSLGKIDHWCLKGGNDSCRCEDPLEPTSRGEYKTWVEAHHANKLLVETWRDSDMLDVAFLGESLVEEMDGRWMGKTHTDQLKEMEKMFRKHFTKEKSGINGVALGVAGDTSPNVLWRLMHGEMPEEFNPSIWWINLGMNDLGRMQCSEEVVVMGILRVVEEILTKKPSAKIVINSMLPMPDLRGGIYPHVIDYRDAFRPIKGQKGIAKVPSTYYARGKTTAGAAGAADKEGTQTKVKKTKPDKRYLKKRDKIAEAHSSDEDEPNNPLTKKEKKKLRKVPREKFHPKMDAAKTHIRKFDPKKGFLKQTRLPLWTSITAINRQLRKFCDKHSQVSYFDATPLFAERSENSKYVLLNERISMRGHPTVEGFKLWEDAMLEKVKKMVEKIQKEKSEQQAAAANAVAAANADTSEDLFTDDYDVDGTDVTGGAAEPAEDPEPKPEEPKPVPEPAVDESASSASAESGSEDSV